MFKGIVAVLAISVFCLVFVGCEQKTTTAPTPKPETKPTTTSQPAKAATPVEQKQAAAPTKAEPAKVSPATPAPVAEKASDQPVLTAGQNLLKNGDFSEGPEKELAQWEWWRDHKISRDAAKGAGRSLKVDCRPGQSLTFAQAIQDVVKPGQRYVLRGYMKTSDATGKATLEIGKQGGWTLTATKPPVSAQEWTLVQTTFTAPADCKGLLALLFCRRDKEKPESACTAWFSNIELFAAVDKK